MVGIAPWKDKLCQEILERNELTLNSIDFWRAAQSAFPSVRFKTADARGKVIMIQLSDRGQWMKPGEWALNHQASIRERMINELRRYLNLVGPAGLENDVLHFSQLNNVELTSTRREAKSSNSSVSPNSSTLSPAMEAYQAKMRSNSREGWEEHFKNL